MTTRPSEPLTTEFPGFVASVRRAVRGETDESVAARRVGELLPERLSAGLPLPGHLREPGPDH